MSRKNRVTAAELEGVIAYLVTPVKDGSDRKSRDAVDHDETARAVERMIDDGVGGFCLNGTFGEAPSLTMQEQKALTATVVEAARARVPVFGGATTLNTRDTIDRVRAAREVGADGVMLGRPMMAELSNENTVQFYRDVAEEVPDMAIFLYDDQEAFKKPLPTKVYAQLAQIPQIVGCKYRSRLMISNLLENTYNRDLEAVGSNIKLMPAEFDWAFVHKNFGIDAIWSTGVNGGPAPSLALRDALFAGKYEQADSITKDICWSYEGLVPPQGLEVWHTDKIPFMKARFAAAGYLKPGPALPPYTAISAERLAHARELGNRAKTLQAKYGPAPVRSKAASAR
jgi:4-(2-carboxyphenyl)-2-oxobut-3-enoate aldolase